MWSLRYCLRDHFFRCKNIYLNTPANLPRGGNSPSNCSHFSKASSQLNGTKDSIFLKQTLSSCKVQPCLHSFS